MKRRFSAVLLGKILCCAALLVLLFAPCTCLAQKVDVQGVDVQGSDKSYPSKSSSMEMSHSCCDEDEQQPAQTSSNDSCNECSDCLSHASCGAKISQQGQAYQSTTTLVFPNSVVQLAFLSATPALGVLPVRTSNDPPHTILSSSARSRSALLQRWLL